VSTVAAIDCGTNTIKLLIGDLVGQGQPVVAVREMRMVRLGQDLDRTGRIADEALERAFAAIDEYAALIAAHDVSRIRFCATSATRDAANADVFTAGVRARLGVAPEVVAGSEEAGLAFDGAVRNLRTPPTSPVLVIDIGGGSTELILGAAASGTPEAAHSMDIGSVRLHERHLRSDPPELAELASARAEIDVALKGVDPPATELVLVVGGSATTLAAAGGGELEPASIARILAVLLAEPAAEAAKRLGLHVERVRLLPAGPLALEAAWGAFGQAPLQVARGGLREGVVMRAFGGRS
jgi:exopolyphosphatase/guanosine-5'-triphosphate,3'-diphosphate pyrophosphatase